MSPRAACRLEALGFGKVYDYELGVADWKAAGLPLEGQESTYQTAADAMRPDIPTCGPTETVGEVRKRVIAAGWEDCLVTDCHGLVIGRLRNNAWQLAPATTVTDAMELGPTAVRANDPLDRLVKRMNKRPTGMVVVATAQGGLLGVVLREEAQRLLQGEPPEMIWAECDGCPGQWRPPPAQT
jgi:hypothetical protein